MMSVLVALYVGNVAVSPPRQLYEATFESFETRMRVEFESRCAAAIRESRRPRVGA